MPAKVISDSTVQCYIAHSQTSNFTIKYSTSNVSKSTAKLYNTIQVTFHSLLADCTVQVTLHSSLLLYCTVYNTLQVTLNSSLPDYRIQYSTSNITQLTARLYRTVQVTLHSSLPDYTVQYKFYKQTFGEPKQMYKNKNCSTTCIRYKTTLSLCTYLS